MARSTKPSTSPSGLEKVPVIYTRPLLKNRFFWITLATAGFWAALIWTFFLS